MRKQGHHSRTTVDPGDIQEGRPTVCVDTMTVNGVCFSHTISRHIWFQTLRAMEKASRDTLLLDCIQTITGQYHVRGCLIITSQCWDNQFWVSKGCSACYKQHHQSKYIAYVPDSQHEPTIEQNNRTTKENIRCHVHHVLFKGLPKRCVGNGVLVYAVIFRLNCRVTKIYRSVSTCALSWNPA